VDPHHDGLIRVPLERAGPHVKKQAILAVLGDAQIAKGAPRLGACGAEPGGRATPSPWRGGLRRAPAQVPHRRLGVGNTEKSVQPVGVGALKITQFNAHMRRPVSHPLSHR
jgi:hypothetical protein